MKSFFQRAEPALFYLLIFLHCLPVILLKFFITHDGPAHVYNSVLIKNLLLHVHTLTGEFYSLRSFPEANWIGHAFMALLGFFISPVAAEHVMLLVYIVLLPLAFRKTILLTNKESVWLSYLIFPFICSYAFYGGLYNFMLGIPLLFFALVFLMKRSLPLRISDYVMLLFSGMLLYFSHLVIFGIYGLLIPVLLLVKHRYRIQNISGEAEGSPTSILKSTILSLLMLTPGVILSAKFIFEKASFQSVSATVDYRHLLKDLGIVNPVIALNENGETKYGVAIGIVLLFLLTGVFITTWKGRKEEAEKNSSSRPFSFFWLTACLFMLLFYFVIPDDFATGGVIKVRFAYFFFLFLILWMASQKIPKTMMHYATGMVVLISLARLYHFSKISRELSEDAETFYSASPFIEPNSIVLPLNYSTNWMHSNVSNYLGTKNQVIVLDNYEAGREHFPLTWNENRNPVGLMGSFNGKPPLCADISTFERKTAKKIDYIILWKYDKTLSDSCSVQIQTALRNNYKLFFKTLDKRLYMYKHTN